MVLATLVSHWKMNLKWELLGYYLVGPVRGVDYFGNDLDFFVIGTEDMGIGWNKMEFLHYKYCNLIK